METIPFRCDSVSRLCFPIAVVSLSLAQWTLDVMNSTGRYRVKPQEQGWEDTIERTRLGDLSPPTFCEHEQTQSAHVWHEPSVHATMPPIQMIVCFLSHTANAHLVNCVRKTRFLWSHPYKRTLIG